MCAHSDLCDRSICWCRSLKTIYSIYFNFAYIANLIDLFYTISVNDFENVNVSKAISDVAAVLSVQKWPLKAGREVTANQGSY